MLEVRARAVRILRKASGGKHHAAAGIDTDFLAVLLHDCTRNPAVLVHEADSPRTTTRAVSGDPAPSLTGVPPVHCLTRRVPRPLTRTSRPWASIREAHSADLTIRGVQKMLEVGAAVQAHAHERRFPHRPGERSQTGPDFSSIERKRMDRSAFLGATGMIGMIVGIFLPKLNLTSVFASRKPTIGPAFVRNAPTRASSKWFPASCWM